MVDLVGVTIAGLREHFDYVIDYAWKIVNSKCDKDAKLRALDLIKTTNIEIVKLYTTNEIKILRATTEEFGEAEREEEEKKRQRQQQSELEDSILNAKIDREKQEENEKDRAREAEEERQRREDAAYIAKIQREFEQQRLDKKRKELEYDS